MYPDDSQASSLQENVYTPTELNHEARIHLEAGFGQVWVEGEISNLSRPASGHIYFSLKDNRAQVRCALFRSNTFSMGFKPANGMQVRARGRVSLYEARGDYQLIANSLEQAGEGLLKAKFEALKKNLEAEGLFEAAIKKTLPPYPLRIAVITSPSGAVIRDILNVLQRRWPVAGIRLYPVPVQGDEAAPAIVQALASANRHNWGQLIVTGRGGGSLEDLWAFNEESVARAIHASVLPVVSAVGHETDFSISDFVADLRAPTPSAAAELVSPDQMVLKHSLSQFEMRLKRSVAALLQSRSQQLDHLGHRLQQQHPGKRLQQHQKILQQLRQRLMFSGKNIIPVRRHQLQELARTLHAVSPLPTLARGYAIVADAATGTAIASVDAVLPGQSLLTQLTDGQISSQVDQVNKKMLEKKKV
jgi:exodeoxyribonuclease VII large subunit